MRLTLLAVLNAGALWLDNVSAAESQLPTVDLGYEVHQALSFNVCHSHSLHSVIFCAKLIS
jgi:hypothetical protein